MFKYFKKRKAVKAAQAAYSQESREYFKLAGKSWKENNHE